MAKIHQTGFSATSP